MIDIANSLFLTIAEAAELLRVKRRTLDNLRWHGEGPRFRRHGGRIIYHRDELLAWSEQRRARLAAERSRTAPSNGHGGGVARARDERSSELPSPPVERQS